MRKRLLDSPIGRLTLIASERGLLRVLFDGQDLSIAGSNDVDVRDVESDAVLDATVAQLGEYFGGVRKAFDLPLDLQGSEFQKAAWLALATIPYGQTTTYGRQAESIGRPGASRAVGAANGRNPTPIVLPCHRVIGADGSLTGFGGGLDVKRQLLDFERGQLSLQLQFLTPYPRRHSNRLSNLSVKMGP